MSFHVLTAVTLVLYGIMLSYLGNYSSSFVFETRMNLFTHVIIARLKLQGLCLISWCLICQDSSFRILRSFVNHLQWLMNGNRHVHTFSRKINLFSIQKQGEHHAQLHFFFETWLRKTCNKAHESFFFVVFFETWQTVLKNVGLFVKGMKKLHSLHLVNGAYQNN